MKRIVLVVALAACGGKSAPATEPAKPADSSGENNGIGQKEVAESACYESCLEDGGGSGGSNWASKPMSEKEAECSKGCDEATKALPYDVKN